MVMHLRHATPFSCSTKRTFAVNNFKENTRNMLTTKSELQRDVCVNSNLDTLALFCEIKILLSAVWYSLYS